MQIPGTSFAPRIATVYFSSDQGTPGGERLIRQKRAKVQVARLEKGATT